MSEQAYLEQHVFLAGCQIHLVLVVVHTDVDNVGEKLLIPRNHLQLLMQALHTNRDGGTNLDQSSVYEGMFYYVILKKCCTVTWVILLWLAKNIERF